MGKHMDVGRTWRTPGKHQLMTDFIRQEIGVARNMRWLERHDWYDLSAGDGVAPDGLAWGLNCSPGILASHALRAGHPVHIRLYEIQAATYDRLLGKLAEHLPGLGYERETAARWRVGDRITLEAFHADGRTADVSDLRRQHAVFVFNDPNAITEWAMRDEFAKDIGDRTGMFRCLSTMGCNPGGLKRGGPAMRLGWFDLVRAHEVTLPQSRDLILAAIERDDAQWAYMLSTSHRWRVKTEAVIRSAFKRIDRRASMSWYREQPDAFQAAKFHLFLTKAERQRITGREAEWLILPREKQLQLIEPPPEDPDPAPPVPWTLFDGTGETAA